MTKWIVVWRTSPTELAAKVVESGTMIDALVASGLSMYAVVGCRREDADFYVVRGELRSDFPPDEALRY